MGLDMYAYFVRMKDAISDTDCSLAYGQVENFYWRKNYRLHNWMVSYRDWETDRKSVV